jgi:hypothetical protein
MTNLPTPYAAERLAAFLDDHLSWSAFWDKQSGLWRVAEDDPDSDLYVESRDADAVIRYISDTPDALQPGQQAFASCATRRPSHGTDREYGRRSPASARSDSVVSARLGGPLSWPQSG